MIARSGGSTTGPQESGSFSGLEEGTYTVSVVADATGSTPACTTAVSTQVIYRPTTITATVAKTNITCNAATDGTITVTSPDGGTHDDAVTRTYQYMIARSGGSTTGPQVSGSFSGLDAGTYTVSVVATATGSTPACTTSVSTQVIYRPTAITATVNKTNVLCNGASDGTITVSNPLGGTHADAGSRTFQYMIAHTGGSITGPQVSGSFTGLDVGTYTVSAIAEATGSTPACTTVVSTQVITQPTPLVAAPAVTSNFNGSHLSCPNSSDGSLAANASGGTAPYSYLWEKNSGTWTTIAVGQSTLVNPTGLNAGTYRVTVTDANNCVTTKSVEIVPPAQASIVTLSNADYKFNGRDVSCYGASDGSIVVTAEGGTGIMAYSSDNGSTWKSGGVTLPNGNQTYTFTGLTAGSYTVVVKDVNGCLSDPEGFTLQNPPQLVISSLTTNGPVNAGESITFTAVIDGGTYFATGSEKLSYSWAKPIPTSQMPSNLVETTNSGTQLSTTFTISTTTPDDNGYVAGYTLTVTDVNGCTASLNVKPIIYPSTIYVSDASGNDLTGDGRSINPLKTIQKAIDVADPTNIIEVQTGTYSESPVVDKELTINGSSSSYLGTGNYFIYGTTDDIHWGTAWPLSVWDNLGMNGDAAAEIGTVMTKVNSNSSATLWLIGNIEWNSTITVSKQLAIRGATSLATVPSYTGCDIVPPTTITFTGSGADTVLFKFTGSTTKSLRDLILEIPNGGKFAEIPNGNSCNVDPVTNVRFDWDHDNDVNTDRRRMYGVTNGSFSVNQKFDVAKFVYDIEDAGYGTGRFVYGNNGTLPWNSLEIGWKAEDGSVQNAGDKIKTLEPMKGAVKLQSLISNGRRPSLNTTAGNYNGKWSMDFDAAANQYLEANTTTEINGGTQKTLFVVFRPLDGANDQVIYKHGDEKYGMSLVHLADGRISMNVYDGTIADKRESWIFESSASSHSATGFDNEVLIAQMYFNGNGDANGTRRVGASLDRESGRIVSDLNHAGVGKDSGYVGSANFTSTTLTTPAVIGPANVAVVGARSGSMYYASWVAGAASGNSPTASGRALFYNGSIAEVVMLNTASESSRDAAYCYLRNKYYGGSQGTGNGLDKRVIAGDDREDLDEVSVWPNPAEDHVSIEAMVPQSGVVTVVLRDALGRVAQVLFEDYVPGGTLLPVQADVRNLVSGAYMIHVTGAGDLNSSLPVIIRH
jgi:uncharacterized protein (DUF2141 family)